ERPEILVGEQGLRLVCEGRGKCLDRLGPDREAGGRPVTAEPLEVLRAGVERPVKVEGRNRAPRALPGVVRAGDQDDGAVVPLDEARGDDPDDALVPVLAGDDVAAAATQRLGPRLDLLDRLAPDPVLDELAVAVQALELRGEPLRLVR